MKVLLTGANGFVGSHILDHLRRHEMVVKILLRRTSETELIAAHLPEVEVHYGSLENGESLRAAMREATHVIHCAGCTKAIKGTQYYRVNQHGTRQIVEAINHPSSQIKRLVFISSLAASRPALPPDDAREIDSPAPVSEYGKSKLAAEHEVRKFCQKEYVILRPCAVYGPRDADFLMLFKAVKARLVPRFGSGRQPFSLIFVKDLAVAATHFLTAPQVAGGIFNIASPEAATARELVAEIARQMHRSPLVIPLPMVLLWLICLGQELLSQVTGQATILSRQKYRELSAPGWTCDPSRARQQGGFTAATSLETGIAETLSWYRQAKWL